MFQVIPVNAMWWHVWLFSSLFLLIGILLELASSIAFRQDVGGKKASDKQAVKYICDIYRIVLSQMA